MEYVFSLKKIIDGNGLAISITGMFIVFCALLAIATFVFFLPKILKIFNNFFPESEEHFEPSELYTDNKEIAAAIGYLLLKNKSNS